MLSSNKKILIIGGTGFIGRNLFNYFQHHSLHKVMAPTRRELNLLDDIACKVYISESQPDIVIHCAVDINSTENTLRMFFNIFNQCHSYGKLIQLGSGAEYDKRAYKPMMNESQFANSVPVDTYGLAKFLIARTIKSSKYKNSFNLRLFGIFGCYEDYSRRFISNNICRALSGLPVSLNRDMLFDYIHVDDLARFILEIIDKKSLISNDYNFCSGNPLYLSKIASMIQAEMGQECQIIIKQDGFNPEYSGDPSKLFSEVGVFKFAPIRDKIHQLANYYRKNFTKSKIKDFKGSLN